MARVSFPELEKAILEFWKKNDIFKKTLQKPLDKGNFVFYEGPPTANGKPGIHHVLARAFKDVIPRYRTMQGFRVERKAGWDTHGLPVELQVEKRLEISGKPGIENLKDDIAKSIEYFNKECKKSVWEYKEDWEKMTERMGFWIDLENPYVTYDNDYIETLWWIVKQVNEKGLLYKGYKVVPHCPRCGTALSSHEVAQGYKEVEENSVFMKFKVAQSVIPSKAEGSSGKKVQPGDYILSWTTTPWTLPGNVALAVGSGISYIRAKINKIEGKAPFNINVGEYYIWAQELTQKVWGGYFGNLEGSGFGEKVINCKEYTIYFSNFISLQGSDLLTVSYEPLFPNAIPDTAENFSQAYKVYPADFVTTEDGTGIVHTAVMYGEDDYQLGEEVGLPKHHTVTPEGNFAFSYPPDKGGERGVDILKKLNGQFVKNEKTEKIILDYLKENNLLYKEESYKHDYPFCWRCETPLLYYAKDSWFIKMSKLRAELKANNEKINWVPEHIKTGRFGEWLEGAKDWALSRERYWGTPLPVWHCQTEPAQNSNLKSQNKKTVIASVAKQSAYLDCHPSTGSGQASGDDNNSNMSEHKEKAVGCGSYTVIGSIEELAKKSIDKIDVENLNLHRPYIDQVKLKCERCSGEMTRDTAVLDCWFDSGSMPFAQHHYPFENQDLIDKGKQFPADYICEAIDQTRGWFYTLLAISTLLNKGTPYKNVICLGHINDKFGKKMSKSKGNVIDPWTVMEKYGADALRFHLYTVNQPGEAKNFDVQQVEDILKKNWLILWNVLSFYKMYAHSTSLIRGEKGGVESVHILDKWLKATTDNLVINVSKFLDKYDINNAGRAIMVYINELSTWYVRRSRNRFKASGKEQQQAVVSLGRALLQLAKILAPFAPFIAEKLYQELISDCPVKDKEFRESVHLEDWPQVKEINNKDKAILNQMMSLREVVEKALAARAEAGIKIRQPLQMLQITDKLPTELQEILKEEINVKEVTVGVKLELDTNINEELKLEGVLRELTRLINALRKESKLTINDKVNLAIVGRSELIDRVLSIFKDDLKNSTLSDSIARKSIKGKFSKEIEIEGEKLILEIKK